MAEPFARALREGIYLALLLSLPPLAAVMVTGAVAAVVQSVLRLEERALSAVPKLFVAFFALAATGPWIATHLVRFLRAVLTAVPLVGRT